MSLLEFSGPPTPLCENQQVQEYSKEGILKGFPTRFGKFQHLFLSATVFGSYYFPLVAAALKQLFWMF